MPKYTRNPAAGTRRPACFVANACPSSWQASASTLRPSSTSAPTAYESPVRKTCWSAWIQLRPNTARPASATRPHSTAATRVNNRRPPNRYRKPMSGSTLARTTRLPRAAASSPRANRTGNGRRFIRPSGRNASTGSSASIRLPARSATTRVTWSGASRPLSLANSATRRATVRVPSMSFARASSSGASRR